MRTLITAALCAVIFSSSAFAGREPDGGPRLRPQDQRIKDALREGALRSATFRALLDRIDAGDVIVYIATNRQIKSSLSGMLTWMTQAGGYRYVRASINPDQAFDQLIATIGHEMQHAVEVIDDAGVTNERTLVELYRRIGQQNSISSPSRWETSAALQTGSQVRHELSIMPATVAMSRGIEQSQS